MQLETCFITRSLAAWGVASVCADVQPSWTGTWLLFIIVQKPFANREEIFVFLPWLSLSGGIGPPETPMDLIHFSLSPMTDHHLTLWRCQTLPVPFETSMHPSSAPHCHLQLSTGQDCSLAQCRQWRACFSLQG